MIPLSTTTIRIERKRVLDTDSDPTTPPPDVDPWEEGYPRSVEDPTPVVKWSTVQAGVRAQISSPGGTENWNRGGTEEVVTWRLTCDPCDLTYLDRVVDESDGTVYAVQYAIKRRGLGLDHVHAGIETVRGVA